jgi:hypothetical protein
MRIWGSMLELARVKIDNGSMKKIALLVLLVEIMVSGCSVLVNSEKFYGDRPQRPINWREYTTD